MNVQRYQWRRCLASGQMSDVWLALDTLSRQEVAVKIMNVVEGDEARNRKTEERFQREIDIAQGLQYPSILPILDHGYIRVDDRQVPYLVSPYVQEGSLAKLLETAPPWVYWTYPQIADAIVQAAESLWYLHSCAPPIVHGDIKPGNFLYSSVNSQERAVTLYLFDFGISRRKLLTYAIASEVIGTLEFMAPEQIRKQVDCASDQYALAVMACLLLTGQYPIQVEQRLAYVEAHQYLAPLVPSVLSPELCSTEVDAVILRALAKDPHLRYPSVLDFGKALQSAITTFCRQQANAPTERDVFALPQGDTMAGEQIRPSRLDGSKQGGFSITFDSLDTGSGSALDEPLPGKPVQRQCSPNLSLAKPDFAPISLYGPWRENFPLRVKRLSWAPQGSTLACVLYGSLSLYVSEQRSIQQVHTHNSGHVNAVCWSPDSTILAVSGASEICFWDAVAQVELPLKLRYAVGKLEGMDWSSQGQLAVWVGDQILVYSLERARFAHTHVSLPQRIATAAMRCDSPGTLRWSPDGTLLVAGSSQGELVCWGPDLARSARRFASVAQKVNCLCWSASGSLLVAGLKNARVVGWNTQVWDEQFRWENLPSMPRVVSISLTDRIAVASSEQRVLLGTPVDTYPMQTVPGQLLVEWSPCWNELATLDAQNDHVLTLWTEHV